MTWQAHAIAGGDYSQRIDFLGDFSIAFNEMAERLGVVLGELRTRERQLNDMNDSLRAAQTKLREQASHDPLTGLLNRRFLSERWTAETARSRRNGKPITVLVADLDTFKSTNDTYGHETGDAVLINFAETLTGQLRQSDIACRLGGDEFAMLLPETTLEDGAATANRIRDAFERTDLASSPGSCPHTASIGAAAYPTHGETLEAVLRAADEALYEGKAGGRNRVVAATCEMRV